MSAASGDTTTPILLKVGVVKVKELAVNFFELVHLHMAYPSC